MSDIDFEELDKAVNSLMNKSGERNSPDIASSDSLGINETQTNSVESPAPAEVKAPPMISKKLSGRFMDVVHPSSDMRRNSTATSMPSRTGVFIQPLDSLREESVSEKVVVKEDSSNTVSNSEAVDPSSDVQPSLAGSDTSTEKSLSDKIAESLADSSKNIADPLPNISTPFLPNPNIEKRPLGENINPGSPATQIGASDINNESIEPEDDNSRGDSIVDESLKPEFSKEILAVEQMGNEEPEEDKKAYNQNGSDSGQSGGASMQAFGDIMPQYTADEEPVTNPAPIFESASSVSGSVGKGRKKSGWLTVLLILLFLIIGIGGGAAAWWFMIK